MAIEIWFYQLREGDPFILEGDQYMKLWRYISTENDPYNARKISDNTPRFVLDHQKVIPVNEYYRDRISPIMADVHEL